MERVALGTSPEGRERDEVASTSASIGSEEARVNDRMKIVNNVEMSSKELNKQVTVEKSSDSLGEDET